MSFKQILAALVLLGLAVAGFFFLKNGPGPEASDTGGEQTPTVVTVQTSLVKRATLRGYVEGFAVIEPAPAAGDKPAAAARITPAVAGVVTGVKISQGQQVEAGAPLFQLDTRVADVAVDFARQTLARQQKLFQSGNTSQKAVQDAEQQLAAAETQRALLSVTAPLAGIVTHLYVTPGEAVDPSMTLAEIADLNRLDATVEIPAAAAVALRPGQTMELSTDPVLSAPLSFISPVVNTTNDTIVVRAALSAGSGLRSGQTVHARIIAMERTNCLAVPVASVVAGANGEPAVAIVTGENALQVPVKTGVRDGPLIEVEGGIKEGDAVVTVGAYGLPEKTKVRIANP